MRRLVKLFYVAAIAICSLLHTAAGQSTQQSTPEAQAPSISVRSNLVLVPAMVKTKAGKLIFSLSADDFILADDGIPQPLHMEADTLSQPLALVVIVQTGGQGAAHLKDYRHLGSALDAVVGGAPHRIAVVSFDSKPHLARDFTTDADAAGLTVVTLPEGDEGAAILDALNFGIDLLRKQPAEYRRAVLLISETIDHGSQATLEDAVHAVEDTNTSIYSFGFSSTRAAVAHEGAKLPSPGGTEYSKQPYPPGGCMSKSKDAKADPDADDNRGAQALDCAGDLIPPLRLARMALLAAKDSLKRNVPKSVAQLTGGEFYAFHDAKTLAEQMIAIANDVPNYYVLSFRPDSPHLGPHALELRLKDKPGYEVRARKGYWVNAPAETKP